MVQFGWKAGAEQYPPVELMNYAIAADHAGFDLLDASDHFHPWSEEGQASFIWTWFGAVATQTQRIMLTSGVTCPILRYHPSIIAQAAATVTHFAPQRFMLGVGTGEALNEYAATGKWPGYTERQERLAEAIDLIQQLWSGKQITFSGQYYKTRKAQLYTLPNSKIPIIISALVPESARFAGESGDGIWTVGGKPIQLYQEMIQTFEESARQAGKDPKTMPRIIELSVSYTTDIQLAMQERLKYWAGSQIPALYNQKIYTPAMSEENGAVVGHDTLEKMGCYSPHPDDHINFVSQFINTGFDYIIFHTAGPDQRAFIENYSRDILPKLRQS